MAIAPENLQVGKLAALQPPIARDEALTPPQTVDDPLVHRVLARLVRLWAYRRRDLPNFFADEVRVVRVRRQPIAFVCVDVQRVARDLEPAHEPFRGGAVDSSPWSTDDPLALLPLEATVFPEHPTSRVDRVPGREEVRRCDDCGGVGKIACRDCDGAGQKKCPACQGAGSTRCRYCDGAGRIVRGGQWLEVCRHCDAGLVRCPECREGLATCQTCGGKGQVPCGPCAGAGRLKHFWNTITESQTERSHDMAWCEPWPIDVQGLLAEAEPIAALDWAWPGAGQSHPDLEQAVPRELIGAAERLVAAALAGPSHEDERRDRASGIRVRLAGMYAYEVTVEHNQRRGRVYVAGTSSLFYPDRLPRPTAGDRFLATMNRTMSWVGLGDKQGAPPRFVRSLRKHQVHLLDEDCILPNLARLGAEVQVVPAGYRIRLPRASCPMALEFLVQFACSAAGELVVATSSRLGPAQRDRFPAALAANRRVLTGRVALGHQRDTGEDEFVLVDRLPYRFLDARNFFWTLVDMAESAGALVEEQVLA